LNFRGKDAARLGMARFSVVRKNDDTQAEVLSRAHDNSPETGPSKLEWAIRYSF